MPCLFSLGAGLDAVLAFEITVAGLAIVNITSPRSLFTLWSRSGSEVGSTLRLVTPETHRFSLDRERIEESDETGPLELLLPLLCTLPLT